MYICIYRYIYIYVCVCAYREASKQKWNMLPNMSGHTAWMFKIQICGDKICLLQLTRFYLRSRARHPT